jgi:hypothetical protein
VIEQAAESVATESVQHEAEAHAESEPALASDFAKATSDMAESAINDEVPLDMHDLDVPAYLRAQQK